ncbi:MAG: hypothetical protein ABIR66_02070 [Saprospiraceae bacterium]
MSDLHHSPSSTISSPQRFEMSGAARTFLLATIGLGLLCLIWIFFHDDQFHTRFWTDILHNSVFFTGIAIFSLFFYAANVVALGGWIVTFKRIWEAYAQFLVVGLILMLIIAGGLYLGYHHLYHWNDATLRSTDKVIIGKSGFLSKNFYTGFSILAMGVWIYLAKKIRAISIDEDINGTSAFTHHIQLRKYSSMALPLIGFMSAACIWLWVMSLDAHWYSTMFAWYSSASLFVSMLVLTIGIILYMKSKGYLAEVTTEHIHDIAKYTFAFSIFWMYLWFSQYMLIWYSNIGEETTYFRERFDHYKVLYYANLILNFLLPFLILMRNDTKRKVGTLILVAALVFFGHWIDFFQMIKPGTLHTAHELMEHRAEVGHIKPLEPKPLAVRHQTQTIVKDSSKSEISVMLNAKTSNEDMSKAGDDSLEAAALASHEPAEGTGGKEAHAQESHGTESSFVAGFTLPGLLDIGVLLGFLAGFLLFVFNEMSKAALQPKKDPYYVESLHHHVQ